KLVGGDDMVSEAAKLVNEKEKLEAEIAELAGQTRTWCQRGLEMDEIDQQVRGLREEARERERRARRVEVAMGIRKQWTKREETDVAIKSLSGLYPLEANAIADLDELNERIEEH